jgi:alpha-2-macroglobulin
LKKQFTIVSTLTMSLLAAAQEVPQPQGLQFEQVQSSGPATPVVKEKTARTTPLSLAELKQLLSRLAPLKAQAGDKTDFALRGASLPAPKAGKRIAQPFPPAQRSGPPAVEKKPFEVLRHSPEGDVELAPQLSITFNQPMTELSSARTPASVPVKLSPETPGEWRWVGTQTLVFQPKTRLPMATEFRAEVTDPRIQTPVSWTFRTPPPRLISHHPGSGPVDLSPLLFLQFDQNVDAEQIARLMVLEGGGRRFALRRASAAEIAQDDSVSSLTKAEEAQRWVVVTPVSPLPAGTTYQAYLEPGVPSLEGPRKTSERLAFTFATYSPLQIDSQSRPEQPPGSALWISFNNPLDPKRFRPETVKVSPELPGVRAVVRGDNLWIHGRTQGRTKYTVVVPAGLTDKYGQTLGKDTPVEFQIGSAAPTFVPPRKNFVVIDPSGPPQLTFTTVNYPSLDVKIHSVEPSDWKAYHEAFSHRWDGKPVQLPGKLVYEGKVDASAPPDQIREVKVDLARALEAGSNQLVLEVSPSDADPDRRRYSTYYGWVQRSQIGANLVADGKQLVAWVNRLADGKPLAEAEVRLTGGDEVKRTGADGVATLAWKGDANAVLIRHGADRLFFPANSSYWGGTFNPGTTPDQTLWYVTDDRKLYKPGETVAVKGWLRRQIHQHRGDLQATTDRTLRYRLIDSRGNEISKGQTAIGKLGGFDFRVALPKNFNLGHARVELQSDGSSHSHGFQVEEFRRPEFEVNAQTDGGTTVVGGRGAVSIEAKYYSGGGLPNAPVSWHVTSSPTNYSPPKWEDWTFGTWTPWWEGGYRWWQTAAPGSTSKSFQGRTDHEGKHRLDLEFRGVHPPRPHSVQASGTVTDVNRQAWSSSTSMLVHPASVYVGIKARSTFVEAGKPLDYQFIVTDLDGRPVAGKPVQVKAYRVSWEYADDDYRSVRKEVFSQGLTSGGAPVAVSIPTSEGGTYQVEATVQDEQNRANQSVMTSWVAGGKQPPKRDVETQELTLIPNKKTYEPGDVAEILVQSPFGEAQALVTLERHGIVERQMLDLSGGYATLRVPLEEAFVPNLHVQVDAVGKQPRVDAEGNPVPGAPPQPAHGHGALNLQISAASRKLLVEVKPQQAKAEPGTQNGLDLVIRDAGGKPVKDSEIALFVVDESVLALVGGDYADPWNLFYTLRSSDTGHHSMRQYVELALPQEIEVASRDEREDGFARPMPAPAMSMAAGAEPMEALEQAPEGRVGGVRKRAAAAPGAPPPPPIKVRTNFSALAFYVPSATSDAEGRVRLPFKLPDNLTRYRIVALAVAGEKLFGKGQSSLVARQPLMVRPSPPRFLNFGDRFELPVVVQNGTDKPMDVDLACRVSNLKLDPKQSGVSLQVPANDRVEVRFPVSADQAGIARFQVAASSGSWADAAELSLPVWTPATTEAFATYGVLDAGATAQPVAPPGDVFKQFGGLEVSTSSTALQELTDAFIYLHNYPYECTEQISSRVLSTVALLPVLQAFDAPGLPSKEELKASMQRDIKRLQGQQNNDGGWDFWQRDRPSVPYVSLHCTHALIRLRKAGHAVPDRTYDQALQYVTTIQGRIPSDYSEYSKRTLQAYAVYLLRMAGKPDAAKARQLIGEWGGPEKTPFESLGWLLPTLSADPLAGPIRKHLNNRATETASTAQFTSAYDEEAEHLLLASSRRDDAILLEALIDDQPKLDLIPKLVRGLLDGRVQGRWANTQENCWVLLALEHYFQKYENVTPDFVARIWLGDQFAGEQSFRGRSADTKDLHVPMRLLNGKKDLVLSKDGPGRLYYRLGMKYAPLNLNLPPMERGFSVERTYEPVDDNRDVRRDSDGTWHIRSGSKVKVTVTMAAPARRYHVALVDPLPAGLEALNPALQGSEPTPRDRGGVRGRTSSGARYGWWWNPLWYEHQNLRDERVEAFSQMVWDGVYHYSYYARATTPGNFVVPPAKAEEMYQPETFGRSASDRVVIDP